MSCQSQSWLRVKVDVKNICQRFDSKESARFAYARSLPHRLWRLGGTVHVRHAAHCCRTLLPHTAAARDGPWMPQLYWTSPQHSHLCVKTPSQATPKKKPRCLALTSSAWTISTAPSAHARHFYLISLPVPDTLYQPNEFSEASSSNEILSLSVLIYWLV